MTIRDAADLFRRINRLAGEADCTDAELREIFVEEGINPSLFLEHARADVKRLLRESPLYWRTRASALRSKLLASVLAAERDQAQKLPRKDLLRNIEATLARMPPGLAQQLAFEHRNFEMCSDEDLQSILVEIECIAALGEPDANE
jgi:primosomal protein N''